MNLMADYCAIVTCRNAFKVKDPDAFEKQLNELGLRKDPDPDGLLWYDREVDDKFAIFGYNPLDFIVEDKEVQIEDVIQPALQDGEICVLREVGYTKCRYDEGAAYAIIITSKHKRVLNLSRMIENTVAGLFLKMGALTKK